ncbi:MAG: nucleotidyltransferase [Bacteroidales bacterium]|nr:nucleotidyltransferase [Bacteroidales bacterium]
MTYPISSNTIANPLLVDLLSVLSSCFNKAGNDFFVIGAASRDILRLYLEAEPSPRRTRDLDIAIAVDSWDDFYEISEMLIQNGFRKDSHMKQRFYFGAEKGADYELDVVPFGGVTAPGEKIYWPPEESPMMSVKGFASVLKDCVDVVVDNAFSFKIPSAPAFFVLKFDAWLDRHLLNDKDAKDMSFILANYYLHEITSPAHLEVLDVLPDPFEPFVAGAYMIAKDIIPLLGKDVLHSYVSDIEDELARGEQSQLLTQSMGPEYGYDIVRDAWTMIANVFKTAAME